MRAIFYAQLPQLIDGATPRGTRRTVGCDDRTALRPHTKSVHRDSARRGRGKSRVPHEIVT